MRGASVSVGGKSEHPRCTNSEPYNSTLLHVQSADVRVLCHDTFTQALCSWQLCKCDKQLTSSKATDRIEVLTCQQQKEKAKTRHRLRHQLLLKYMKEELYIMYFLHGCQKVSPFEIQGLWNNFKAPTAKVSSVCTVLRTQWLKKEMEDRNILLFCDSVTCRGKNTCQAAKCSFPSPKAGKDDLVHS